MLDHERRLFEFHAKSVGFRRRVAEAEAIIQQALACMAVPVVAFSGGKDSTIVLNLVRAIRPETPAHFGHEQWILPETEEFVATIPNLIRTALPDRHAEWFDVWRDEDAVPDGIQLVDKSAGLNEFNYEREMLHFDGKFLGLRSDENNYRRIFLKRHGTLFFCHRHGLWECNPLARWSVLDVWAYIVQYDVPYNAAYNKLAALGVSLEKRRIGPLAQERILGCGQLAILKRGWPDLFNRFAARFPEARSYI